MDNENEKKSFFDITQYSERTRKIIFGVVMGLFLVVVGIAMFVISPQNSKAVEEQISPSANATQAAVDNETQPTPSTPATDVSNEVQYNGKFPANEEEAAAQAQQKIIEEGKAAQEAQKGKVIEDTHDDIPDAAKLQTIASKGMLAYCIDNPKETKEQKQARLKPYFHTDNSDYQSPQSGFYLKKCSVEGITEPTYDDKKNIVVHVGVAWGAQFDENGTADTGYTQYTVIVDKNGIVSFND